VVRQRRHEVGGGEQEFYGYEGSGGTVGVAKLKIINKAC
jgi:hypothetical protein